MGHEVKGAVRVGKQRYTGKILLETNEIIFRGSDYRSRIAFSDLHDVKAVNGELHITTSDGLKIYEIGAASEKWREKITHPKSRLEKLGVKAGTRVRLLGDLESQFLRELKDSKAEILEASDAEMTFLAIDSKVSLSRVAKYAKIMRGAQALWMVYPKGKKEITEIDVIAAARKSGLKDMKVVGFSATHTALKFVLPVRKR
jgi:hypothetical protein